MNLDGKRALVLGGTGGIGRALALALARAGARVCVQYFDWESRVPELEAALSPLAPGFRLIRQNLLESGGIPGMMEQAVAGLGGLEILMVNMERGGWPRVHGPYTQEQWDLELATTLRAKHWVLDAAMPYLKEQETAAAVIFTSIAALTGRSGPAAPVFSDGYAAANRAARSLTRTFARMGAPSVRVNELMLGFMDTRHGPGTRGWELLSEKEKEAIIGHTLLGRTGSPGEAAAAALFLASDAGFMTGACLRLDGGYILGGEELPPIGPGAAGPEESVFGS